MIQLPSSDDHPAGQSTQVVGSVGVLATVVIVVCATVRVVAVKIAIQQEEQMV